MRGQSRFQRQRSHDSHSNLVFSSGQALAWVPETCTQLLGTDPTWPPILPGGLEPVLKWFGKNRGWSPSGILHLPYCSTLEHLSPQFKLVRPFPLTLRGKIKPYLFSFGKIPFLQSAHVRGEVDSAELRAGDEPGMDLFHLANVGCLLWVTDVVGAEDAKGQCAELTNGSQLSTTNRTIYHH